VRRNSSPAPSPSARPTRPRGTPHLKDAASAPKQAAGTRAPPPEPGPHTTRPGLSPAGAHASTTRATTTPSEPTRTHSARTPYGPAAPLGPAPGAPHTALGRHRAGRVDCAANADLEERPPGAATPHHTNEGAPRADTTRPHRARHHAKGGASRAALWVSRITAATPGANAGAETAHGGGECAATVPERDDDARADAVRFQTGEHRQSTLHRPGPPRHPRAGASADAVRFQTGGRRQSTLHRPGTPRRSGAGVDVDAGAGGRPHRVDSLLRLAWHAGWIVPRRTDHPRGCGRRSCGCAAEMPTAGRPTRPG
jgi:hypothetical protein